MKYLLDTHAAIWALGDKAKLSVAAKSIIDDVSVALYASIVSAWEVAVKVSLGKLDFPGGALDFLKNLQRNGIILLPLKASHVGLVERLPLIHRDPFDRLLISSALADDMTIITADANFRKYDVPIAW
ncbi:MAG: type II toxin-antitoxin system VapC family toxin [Clostridiales bacterium]|nr:type II toxin-antitoxin system VapC family toxin [Clostridiales bacterium]